MILSLILIQAMALPTVIEASYFPQTGELRHRFAGPAKKKQLHSITVGENLGFVNFWKEGNTFFYVFRKSDPENYRNFSIQLLKYDATKPRNQATKVGEWSPSFYSILPTFSKNILGVATLTIGGDQPPREHIELINTNTFDSKTFVSPFHRGIPVVYSGKFSELLRSDPVKSRSDGENHIFDTRYRLTTNGEIPWKKVATIEEKWAAVISVAKLSRNGSEKFTTRIKRTDGKVFEIVVSKVDHLQFSQGGNYLLLSGAPTLMVNGRTGTTVWRKSRQDTVRYWVE